MKKSHFIRNLLVRSAQVAIVAAFLFYSYFYSEKFVTSKLTAFLALPISSEIAQTNFKLSSLQDKKEELISSKVGFIEVNLSDMAVRLYQNGEIIKDYPILVKGKENDWGETPVGLFEVRGREREHYSSLGGVFMPYSLRFQGNYYIHGLPYYSDGSLTGADYSSGCINLKTADAKELFETVSVNVPVLVLEGGSPENTNGTQKINLTAPKLTAQSYLVADLDNSQIFIAKEPQTIYPIVGVNKLLTGIAASELLRLSFDPNIIDKLYINEKMLLPPGNTADLNLGEKFTFFDLYYPLLVGHSNDASEALALRFNRNYLSILKTRALSLGMSNTTVIDSYGGENGNFSTSEDLFYLIRYLFNNRLWMLNISRGQIYKNFGKSKFTQIENKNLFSEDPNFIGGFTEQNSLGLSTSLFVFKFNLNGAERNIGIILIGSTDVLKDVQAARSYLDKIYF
ncbi:MAG: L,D-transpeptidase family protein [Minisyncoccia bacterium]